MDIGLVGRVEQLEKRVADLENGVITVNLGDDGDVLRVSANLTDNSKWPVKPNANSPQEFNPDHQYGDTYGIAPEDVDAPEKFIPGMWRYVKDVIPVQFRSNVELRLSTLKGELNDYPRKIAWIYKPGVKGYSGENGKWAVKRPLDGFFTWVPA